ncbi:MAG: redoxin domain-containing protein [Verrucomicrobiota bacterium]
MKSPYRLSTFALAILTLTLAKASAADPKQLPEGFTNLNIGDPAPDFSLPGTNGKQYTLADFEGPDVLMVLFTGTHCPTSHGIEERLQTHLDSLEDESFAVVAINPNHSSGLRPDEFGHTAYDETFEDSKRYAEDLGWTFPYLYDGDEQLTARAYGCLATPHVFVFDKDRKLRYNGRYDDSRFPDPATVKSPDAKNAIAALLAGKPVPVETTRPHGCSTKWKERSAHVAEDEALWQAAEVTVEEIDAPAVASLRKNGTEKVRLFNVWATWCGPCVQEMPDLTDIARKFSRREFELITISLDSPDRKDAAAEFLGKHRAVMSDKLKKSVEAEGRTTNNYLYAGASTDDLAEALDPEWPGPVPYSVLVNQDGEIIYRHTGIIDPVEVKTKVLEVLSPYHTPKPAPNK